MKLEVNDHREYKELNDEEKTINDSNWYSEMHCLLFWLIFLFLFFMLPSFITNDINLIQIINLTSIGVMILSIFLKSLNLYIKGLFIFSFITIIFDILGFLFIFGIILKGNEARFLQREIDFQLGQNLYFFATIILIVIILNLIFLFFLWDKRKIFIAYQKSMNN